MSDSVGDAMVNLYDMNTRVRARFCPGRGERLRVARTEVQLVDVEDAKPVLVQVAGFLAPLPRANCVGGC